MKCPNCGMETSPLDNGPCLLCKSTVAHSGLSKIEPLDVAIIPAEVMRVEESLVNKLNEVIEKVNLMMEVMNRRVK